MTHDEVRDLAPQYALGEVDAVARTSIAEHLKGCGTCRAEFLVAFRCCQELKTIRSFPRGGQRAAGSALIGRSKQPSFCR